MISWIHFGDLHSSGRDEQNYSDVVHSIDEANHAWLEDGLKRTVKNGDPGFLVTTIDNGVVSWKFKPIAKWPLVMIPSPADQRLIIEPANAAQVVRGPIQVRARVWGEAIETVTIPLEHGKAELRALVVRA